MHVKFAPLPVSDPDRAIRFYETALGCTLVRDEPYGAGGWRWVELKLPGGDTYLHLQKRTDGGATDTPAVVIVADNVQRLVDILASHGTEILTEPCAAPWGVGVQYAEFRDSEGNRIVLGSA